MRRFVTRQPVRRNGVELVLDVYRATREFPKAEAYGLTSQIRRAAVSIPSNIAEGKGKLTDRDFALSLRQARGSLLELETQLLIAGELGYLDTPQSQSLAAKTERLAKMINALLNVLGVDNSAGRGKGGRQKSELS